MSKSKITVLGAGSWGIALANQYRRLGHQVIISGRDEVVLDQIRKTGSSERYFPGLSGAGGIEATSSYGDALRGSELVVVALPSTVVRDIISKHTASIDSGCILLSATKGIEEGTDLRMSQVLEQEVPQASVAVVTGPSFAVEVLKNLPTAVTVASENPDIISKVVQLTHGDRFRVYAVDDVIGAELGGTLKNVLAIAAGIVDGAKLGVNARAALLTRGLTEIRRLVVASGGKGETVMGLSGMGDLLLTATSDLSRNRRVGLALGQGGELSKAMSQIGQVTEGVYSAKQVVDLGQKLGVELPISETVFAILSGKFTVEQGVSALFARSPKRE